MLSTFDPRANLSDWIQDDWESDDYIETCNRSAVSKSEQKSDKKDSPWLWLLAIAIFFMKSPLFWFALVAIVFILD